MILKKKSTGLQSKMIDYESRYYGLLHILKSFALIIDLYNKGLVSKEDFHFKSADFISKVDSEVAIFNGGI